MKRDMRLTDDGEATFQALRRQGRIVLDVEQLERSLSSSEIGHRIFLLLEQYRSRMVRNVDEVALYQRAIAGWLLSPALDERLDEPEATISIPAAQPEDAAHRNALRLLSMVAELHKAGYQRLRIAAGMSPSGFHWRCHIIPADNVRLNGWEPSSWDTVDANYSSADEDRYFGWEDAPGKTARDLARLFLERFPAIAMRGAGRDLTYAGWFVQILGAAENGQFPVFCADYSIDTAPADMPPPPTGTLPRQMPDLIDHEHLTEAALPGPNASWNEIAPFCLTYDGYFGGLRSAEECFDIARSGQRIGFHRASMDQLRTLLFIFQRQAKWDPCGFFESSESKVLLARAAIAEIRSRLNTRQKSPEYKDIETLLEVGVDQRTIRLIGMRVDGKWLLRVTEHPVSSESVSPSTWLTSWRNALEELDKHHWPYLQPHFVHPLFRKKLEAALSARFPEGHEQVWRAWHPLRRV